MSSQISKQLVQFEESFRQLEKEVKALEAENEDLKKKLAAAYAKIAQYEPEVVEVPGEPDPVPSDSGAPVAAAASAKSSKFKIVKDFLFTRSKPEDEKKAKAQKEAAAAAAAKSKKDPADPPELWAGIPPSSSVASSSSGSSKKGGLLRKPDRWVVARSLEGHSQGGVSDISWCPFDANIVASCGMRDGTARLWNLQGNSSCCFSGHTRGTVVNTVRMHHHGQGRLVVTAGADGACLVWRIPYFLLSSSASTSSTALHSPRGASSSASTPVPGSPLTVVLAEGEGETNNSPSTAPSSDDEAYGGSRTSASKSPVLTPRATLGGNTSSSSLAAPSSLSPASSTSNPGQLSGTAAVTSSSGLLAPSSPSSSFTSAPAGGGSSSSLIAPSSSPILQHPQTAASLVAVSVTEVVAAFREHSASVVACDWLPSHPEMLVSGSLDSTIRIWDVSSSPVSTSSPSSNAQCISVQFAASDDSARLTNIVPHPNQMQVMAPATDGLCRVWDLRERRLSDLIAHSTERAPVTHALYSHDGGLIITGADDRLVKLWDPRNTQQPLDAIRCGSVQTKFSLSRRTNTLAIPMVDRKMKICDTQGYNCGNVDTQKVHKEALTAAIWSDDESVLLTSSSDDKANLVCWVIKNVV